VGAHNIGIPCDIIGSPLCGGLVPAVSSGGSPMGSAASDGPAPASPSRLGSWLESPESWPGVWSTAATAPGVSRVSMHIWLIALFIPDEGVLKDSTERCFTRSPSTLIAEGALASERGRRRQNAEVQRGQRSARRETRDASR